MKKRYLETRFALRDASERLLLSFWCDDTLHVRDARQSLTEALCCGGDFDILVECIEEVIRKNPDAPAHAVASALLDAAIPLTEE